MATSLPQITTTHSDGGWLVSCATCGHESWHGRRPAADLASADHAKTHGPRGLR